MCNINYEYYKKHNICVKCGQNDAEKNHTLCLECMMKERERSLKYYHKNKNKIIEKKKVALKNRYEKLKKQGICTICGKRRTINNKVLCQYCSAKKNAHRRKKYLLKVYAIKNMAEIRI